MKRVLLVLCLVSLASSAHAAIAADAYTSGGNGSTTTHNFNHTCTGSNLILAVGILVSGDSITGVTYNSVAMTQVGTSLASGDGEFYVTLWILVGPSTGTNQVHITKSGSVASYAVAASYTGASQSSQPNAFGSSVVTGASATTTLTTTADNAWMAQISYDQTGGPPTAGAGTTLEVTNLNFVAWLDSNGALTPAGSHSLVTNPAISGKIANFFVAIAPVSACTGKLTLALLGVGRC